MPLPAPPPPLSTLHSLSSHHLRLPFLPFPARRPLRRGDLAIRMGGGPRTFPGGVTKWQWKRMQARKAKQLLKARLARERQLYDMRKRAELRDAVAHLERPWDPDSAGAAVAAAPNLLSVAADDQLRALADRFHRPGGVDLWNDRDGPRVFASPETGRSSARFFPKNAVHSVQPYKLLGAKGEGVQDFSGREDEEVRDGGRAQGARENAPVEDFHSDQEVAVELMEMGGMWEPVIAFDGECGDSSSDRSCSGDDNAIYDSEDVGDVRLGRARRAIVRQVRSKSGTSKWKAANTMAAAGSNAGRDQSGHGPHGFFSDSEGAIQDRFDKRWQESSSDGRRFDQRWQERSREGRRKHPIGRRKTLSTVGGSGSFSDSEMTTGGFERKWRSRNRADTNDSAGKWKVSYDGYGNATRKEWVADESDSDSDNGTRDARFEPKWKVRNRLTRSENRRDANGDRSGRYMRGNNGDGRGAQLKHNDANATTWDRPRRDRRGSNCDGRDGFGNGFAAADLEEPRWKTRRRSGAGESHGRRAYSDGMSGRLRRGGNGSARWSEANPVHTFRENGREGGRHWASRNGGRRFRGGEYSLRPTSEEWTERGIRGSGEM